MDEAIGKGGEVQVPAMNPAADPRLMRRVIAEDPKWNLETIRPLKDVVIKYIVDNFHKHPILDELDPYFKEKVLEHLPTDVPLATTAPLISDEDYWKKCCKSRWELCDIADHSYSWKTLFFERHVQEAVESFVPGQSSVDELEQLLKLCSKFVKRLVVRQLLPPVQDTPLIADDDDGDT